MNNPKAKTDVELNRLLSEAEGFLKSGNPQNAVKIYNDIIAVDNSNLKALEGLGRIFARLGKVDLAKKIFFNLHSFYPENAQANNYCGEILTHEKKYDDCIKYFQKAISLDGSKPNYFENLARIYLAKNEVDKAVEALERAFHLNENNISVVQTLVDITFFKSHDECFKYLKKLYELRPTDALKISVESYVPSVFKNQGDIDKFREQLLKKLEKLQQEELKIDILKDRIYLTPFYLSYQASNSRVLKQKIANILERSIPDLRSAAPHTKSYKYAKGKKIKVGFLSDFFYKHSVSMCFNNIILALSRDERFEVHIFHYGKSVAVIERAGPDEYLKKIIDNIPNYHKFKEDYNAIKNAVLKEQLDVVIYPDVGMSGISYYLAFSRFAPIQAMLPGHPDTSGIKEVDYYLSCNDFEFEGAEDFYSEKLVRFKNMPSMIEKPSVPEKFKTREELGLPKEKKIYYCPMKNQKIHPDFDLAIKEILLRDKNSVILFPRDTGKVSDIYLERIKNNISPDLAERIIYHPWASKIEFMSYIKQADVILDTFHFGAGTTLFYAFAIGAPIITFPAKTSVGRSTYAAYKQMGVMDLIAKDEKDYVNLAIKCANDTEFRNSTIEKIIASKDVIYNNPKIVEELKDFLLDKLSKFE
jgi:protein O-GlcNAc transferase